MHANEKMSPKVSVIIPVLNGAKHISHALQSVFDQSFRDFEIIVIDDGSVDDTSKILKQFDNKIKYIYQNKKGVSAARNLGIREAMGEYVAFLDHDDTWLPDKLTQQMAAIEQNQEVDLIFSDTEFNNDKGLIKASCRPSIPSQNDEKSLRFRMANAIFNDGSIIKGNFYKDLLMGNVITMSSVFVRKDCLKKTGCFDESLSISEDYDLWLRISRTHNILYLNKVTMKYLFRDDSSSGKAELREYVYKSNRGRVLGKQLQDCPKEYKELIKNKILESYRTAIWAYFNISELKKVRTLCLQSLRVDMFQIKVYLYLAASFLPEVLIKLKTQVKFRGGDQR